MIMPLYLLGPSGSAFTEANVSLQNFSKVLVLNISLEWQVYTLVPTWKVQMTFQLFYNGSKGVAGVVSATQIMEDGREYSRYCNFMTQVKIGMI
jgi:hypothetical protein